MVAEEFCILKRDCPAEHPDSHGLIERLNRTLQAGVFKMRDDRPFRTLQDVQMALLAMVNEANATLMVDTEKDSLGEIAEISGPALDKKRDFSKEHRTSLDRTLRGTSLTGLQSKCEVLGQ